MSDFLMYISGSTFHNVTKFALYVPIIVLGPTLVAWYYVHTSGFVDDIVFFVMGPMVHSATIAASLQYCVCPNTHTAWYW